MIKLAQKLLVHPIPESDVVRTQSVIGGVVLDFGSLGEFLEFEMLGNSL